MLSNIGIAVLVTGGEDYIESIFPGEWPTNAVAFVNKLRDRTIKFLHINAIPYYYQEVNNQARLRNAALWYFRDKEYVFMVEDMVKIEDEIVFTGFVASMIGHNNLYLPYAYDLKALTPIPGFELFKGSVCREVGALDLTMDSFWQSWCDYLSRIDGMYQNWVENRIACVSGMGIQIEDIERLNYYQEQAFDLFDFGGSRKNLPIKEPEGRFYL